MAISTLSAICSPNVAVECVLLAAQFHHARRDDDAPSGKARDAPAARTVRRRGLALKASSMMRDAARRRPMSCSRCSTGLARAIRPARFPAASCPAPRAAVQHSSRLEMECSPSSRVWQFASSPVWISTSVNRVPHGPQRHVLGVAPACPALYFCSSGQRS